MESQQQQQRIGKSEHGSSRIFSVDVDTTLPSYEIKHLDNHEDPHNYKKPAWRKFMGHVGPGFLVSLAYLDPGNLQADLQAGASHRYELLWAILVGLVFAYIIQSLAANLGVSSGKHLSELCKAEYPAFVKYCLWFLAEIAVIGADIPEVIGTAFALNILFNLPLWSGVLLTGLSTLLLLGLQKYGIRKLEMLIAVLVFVMAACFFGEMGYLKPPAVDVIQGIFVPKLSGHGATGDAIALLGQWVMPHNLFLHSALVLSREVPNSVRGINYVITIAGCMSIFHGESGLALFVAFLINVAIVSVSGSVCHDTNLSDKDTKACSDLTLNSASFLLQNVLGKSSRIIFAIALLASGQSSSITGTYAGQFVMQGFLDIKMKKWARNLMTRCIAITPSLVVSIISGPSGAGRLIIIASMVLSFELPFALIPLLKFSSSATKMGPHKNSIYIIVFSWILGFGIIGINIYYLSTAFVGWLIHSSLPKVANVFIALLVFPLMLIYILAIIYLTLRKDTIVTFIQPTKEDPTAENEIENGLPTTHGPTVPFRKDLVDIPLPK